MSTNRRLRALLVGATTLSALLASPVAPAAASHEPACTTGFGDTDHNRGQASYRATPVLEGKGKKQTITAWVDGFFHADLKLQQAPLCLGTTLRVIVQAVPGGPALGWTTTGTTTDDANPLGAPTAETVVSEDGRTATVTFSGDGFTTEFIAEGTTADSYGQRCVQSIATVTNVLGAVTESRTVQACGILNTGGGGGGQSYFG